MNEWLEWFDDKGIIDPLDFRSVEATRRFKLIKEHPLYENKAIILPENIKPIDYRWFQKPIQSEPFTIIMKGLNFNGEMIKNFRFKTLTPPNSDNIQNFYFIFQSEIEPIQFDCPINKRIFDILEFDNDNIKVSFQEKDGIVQKIYRHYLSKNFNDILASSLYSETIDLKNDTLFIRGLNEILLLNNIQVDINDIRNNIIEYIEQIVLLNY